MEDMASPVSRREKRVSRITTACNPCRSRKQKCSGERPICGQCLEYHRQCAWPEQLKRGPAKGYIEALETRLYETENVLLKMLSHLSQSQLSSMLSSDENDESERGNKRDQIQQDTQDFGSLSRQREVEYWKANPLNSVANIQRWGQECLDIRNRPENDNNDVENTTPTRRPRRTKSATKRKTRDEDIGQDHIYNTFQEQQQQTGHSRQCSEMRENSPDNNNITETPPQQLITTASPFDASIADKFGPVYYTTKDHATSTTARTPQLSAWEEAPSISFQKQFLW